MSGIVGIVNWDGAPVDRRLLERLTDALSARGTDARRICLDDSVGFGHAWLRTSDDSLPDLQPLSLDGHVWITADVRVDGRAELVSELTARGCRDVNGENDAALILHAYRAWGEDCVHHLLGDFVFAIWDGPRRRLFCARDHFGVKPLFFAQAGACLVFSNTLDCVRRHPSVSGRLNEQAIGDFLLFGGNQDPATSAFADIHRLPPAHRLVGSGRLRPTRYWTLPIDSPIRYRRRWEYVDHFRDLLESAVADRLRSRRCGVLMSGGLDSTSVAATAKRWRSPQGSSLRAFTGVCDRLIVDPEPRYARLAAQALDIPIHFRVVDDYQVFERWEKPELRRPEPESDPLLAADVDQLQDVAAHSGVVLTGYGGDPVFRTPVGYAVDLLTKGKLLRLGKEIGEYILACHRAPRMRIGVHLRRLLGLRKPSTSAYPVWLNPGFAARAGLRERWAASNREPARLHPTRPAAYSLLTAPEWPFIFESCDPGVTNVPVEARHPFFDLRLVRYLLAIPPLPWCYDKTILRLAMREVLPDPVRLRPKAVVTGDILVPLLREPAAEWVDRFEAVPALRAFVDRDRVPPVCGEGDSQIIWTNLRPLCLNYWLRSQAGVEPADWRTA